MEDGDIIELDPSLDNYSQQEAEDISESFSILPKNFVFGFQINNTAS